MNRYKISLLAGLLIGMFACKDDSLFMGNNSVDSGEEPGLNTGGSAVVPGSGGGAGMSSTGGSTTGGATVASGGTGGASTTTTIPVSKCGNGRIDSAEQCDDGNTVTGDGCDALCQLEASCNCALPGQPCLCSPSCGNGILEANETCDDGNTLGGDGCSSACQIEAGAYCPSPGQPCQRSTCGNGIVEQGELCDCGSDPNHLPSGCKGINGLFYGDGKGCSRTCTREPSCLDSAGKTQACTTACGDGNVDPGEECDDGNQVESDGCSSRCKIEAGFTCTTSAVQASTTCQSGAGQCLELPIIYRDFQPENVAAGGHPDFFFLGTKAGNSKSPTTICVPNSAGPAHGSDATARCWGIVAPTLLNGKPQPGSTTTCTCQFSDWNLANGGRIPGNYTEAGNDSPLSDGNGSYLGNSAGSSVSVTGNAGLSSGIVIGYTSSTPGGPIWQGTTPAYKDANSFRQWFNDDATVNKTYTGVLEMPSIGTNLYQYASTSHLAQGGFFPLDTLNASQATLCNLMPYWNHGDGTPIWSTCQGDQYFLPPRLGAGDCGGSTIPGAGCWVSNVPGAKHDSYFTDEARYYFVYDGTAGFSLGFFGDDDLFVFINGNLVLDLGGVHQQLPGKITVNDSTAGDAMVTEGGCLDAAGNITGVSAGSTACSPNSTGAAAATTPDDFRVRTVKLGLVTGKTYEIAIFGADRHPPESNFQLTLNGFTTKRSVCTSRCGDGIVSAGEECDSGSQNDGTYGGCTSQCKFAPYCGDGVVNGPEECDLGQSIGSNYGGCTPQCKLGPYCGDGIVNGPEACDLGSNNGQLGSSCTAVCTILLP